MSEVAKIRVTAEEYFQLPETNQPTELLEGEIIVSPAPVPLHQIVIRDLILLLSKITPGGELLFSPIDVYLDDDNVLQPDLIWIAPNSKCQIGEKRLTGAPDLIVEVLSPSTARRDKSRKYMLYEKHGVREYWIVDPIRQTVEVWRLENREFTLQGTYGADEQFESGILGGQTVNLSDVFQR